MEGAYKEGFSIDTKTEKRPQLQIIRGTYPRHISRGSLSIVAAPKESPPFPVNAVAFEEDTFLVLSADPVVRAPKESLMQVMTRVIETRPQTPGSVLVKGKRPLRLLAIIHDFNQDPSWREEWIASALDRILAEAETQRLRSIAVPFLGTLHGSLEKQRFVVLLRDALERNPAIHLKRLWLVVPEGTSSKILDILESNSQG